MPGSPLPPKLKFSFVTLIISYRSSGDKLIKCQANTSCVILSLILMTTLFYKAMLLQGEIWCWSLLGFKGLNIAVTQLWHWESDKKAQVHEVFILLVQKENLFTLKAILLPKYPALFHSYNIYHYFPRDLPLFPRSACVPTQTTSCKTLRKCHIKRTTDWNQTKAKSTIENLM